MKNGTLFDNESDMTKLEHIYLVDTHGNCFLGNEFVNDFKPMLETFAKG